MSVISSEGTLPMETEAEKLIGRFAETRCRVGELPAEAQVIILGVIEKYKDPLLDCEIKGRHASFRLSDLNVLEAKIDREMFTLEREEESGKS